MKVVKNQKEVAAQGGEPCVIIQDDADEIYLRGYNLSTQRHNYKIRYRITVKALDWDLNPGKSGTLSDIPSSMFKPYDVRQWEVGDLNGDGELDTVDEDENLNARLDFGEDQDSDGNVDVNEDMDGDGKPD